MTDKHSHPEVGYGQEKFLADEGTCPACDQTRKELMPVEEEKAHELFGNWTIYFEHENGRIAYRSWWSEIDKRLHHLPKSKRYWATKTAIAKGRYIFVSSKEIGEPKK